MASDDPLWPYLVLAVRLRVRSWRCTVEHAGCQARAARSAAATGLLAEGIDPPVQTADENQSLTQGGGRRKAIGGTVGRTGDGEAPEEGAGRAVDGEDAALGLDEVLPDPRRAREDPTAAHGGLAPRPAQDVQLPFRPTGPGVE